MAKKIRMPELKFNAKIYKKEAIQKAISAYSHLAKFSLQSNKNYIKVEIVNIAPQFRDAFLDEFSNYVLGMTKKCL